MRLRKCLQLIATVLIACFCTQRAAFSRPQDSQSEQNQSVAEAARRNRERKKNAAKSTKVLSDDDLGKRPSQPGPDGVNVGAPPRLETQPPSAEAVAAAEAADKDAEKEALRMAAEEDAQIVRLKQQIALAEKDLDLLQRELALDQDTYYSKPDYANNTAGKAKLDAEKAQINDKQQEIERLKTRLAALEELKSHRKHGPAQTIAPPQNEKPAAAPPAQI
jgi:hypothetical protein